MADSGSPVNLYALTEVAGEAAGATALVWAEDPGEARSLLREKAGKDARVCREVQPGAEPGIDALIGIRAGQAPRDLPLMVSRPLDRAAEAAEDAAACAHKGDIAEARALLAEALRELATAAQRAEGTAAR